MKTYVSLVLSLFLLLSVTGCGSEPAAAPEPTSAPAATPVDTPTPTATPEPIPERLSAVQTVSAPCVLYALNPNANFALGKTNGEGEAALLQWLCSEPCVSLLKGAGSEYGVCVYTFDDSFVPCTEENADAGENAYLRLGVPEGISPIADLVLPAFEALYGYTVEVMTGSAEDLVTLSRSGGVDVLLLPEGETQKSFASLGLTSPITGFSSAAVPYASVNSFLCGPESDPLPLTQCGDLTACMELLAAKGIPIYTEDNLPVVLPHVEGGEVHSLAELDTDPLTAMKIAEASGMYVVVSSRSYLRYLDSIA